jgi:hypothetical protein
MERFFVFFGKTVLVLLVMGALAGGGYYLGKSGTIDLGLSTPAPEAVSTTNPDALPTQDDTMPRPSASTTSTASLRTLTAGLGVESGLSFTKYSIQIPPGWTPNHTYENQGTPIDTLTVTNGEYQLKIYQAATGGAMCLYAGEPDQEGPSSKFISHFEFTNGSGDVFRGGPTIVPTGVTQIHTVCMKPTGTSAFAQPTTFGHITIQTPTQINANYLNQVVAMIQSLKKVN